jgi:hypothetical protein
MAEPIIRLTKDVSTKQKLIDFINSIPDQVLESMWLLEPKTKVNK